MAGFAPGPPASYTETMGQTPSARVAAIINLLAFIGMLVVNILATSLPLNNLTTGELSDALPNLFVPIGFTFSIWGVIWLLLAAYLVAQFRYVFSGGGASAPLSQTSQPHVDLPQASRSQASPSQASPPQASPYAPGVVGVWFPLNMVLNAGWIFAWHYQFVGVSVLIMLALLATLIVMFLRLDQAVSSEGGGSARFARVPISVYFGWITIATIANITAFLVSVNWDGWGVSEVVWTVVVIVVGLLVTLAMLVRHRAIAFSAVAVWAFVGIAAKRISEGTPEGPAVLVTAIIAAVVIVGAALAVLVRRKAHP